MFYLGPGLGLTRQTMNSTGAPVNPSRGTFPSSLCLVRVMASKTYWSLEFVPSCTRSSRSFGSFSGEVNFGPYRDGNPVKALNSQELWF